MKLAITGATGLVGRFVAEAALRAGHDVTSFTRSAPQPGTFSAHLAHWPYDLEADPPPLDGFDRLVHAAFDHVPGRYRGGEGADPERFRRRNVLGSQRIVEAAGDAGCRVIFLSSRAVYGAYPDGTRLTEDTPPRPDTLYGEIKLAVEQAVAATEGVSLRATGVYGPTGLGPETRRRHKPHKWAGLFEEFAAGRAIPPRRATEVHGADLAAACLLALAQDTPPVLNVSDLMLDRRDLLALWSEISGVTGRLPEPAPLPGPPEMDCTALRALGWQPGGWPRLRETLAQIAQAGAASTP